MAQMKKPAPKVIEANGTGVRKMPMPNQCLVLRSLCLSHLQVLLL
jgi:hypothetical protein